MRKEGFQRLELEVHKPDFVADNLKGALQGILTKERGGKVHDQSSAKQIPKEDEYI